MAPPPTKKYKQRAAQKADASSEPSPKLAQVATLSRALSTAATTGGNLNPLADLVELVRSSAEPEVVHSGVYALGRVFSALIVAGKTDVAQRSDDHETVVRKWVTQRLDEYVDYCGSLFNDIEKDLRVSRSCLTGDSCTRKLTRACPSSSPPSTTSLLSSRCLLNCRPRRPGRHRIRLCTFGRLSSSFFSRRPRPGEGRASMR